MRGYVKIKYHEYPSGTVQDWSSQLQLQELDAIARKVESENAGEAGLVVYNDLGVTFTHEPGSDIYNAFDRDLSSVQRYIYELFAIKKDKTEKKIFEGMADFRTLEFPDGEKKVSLEIKDKLSALDIITNTNTQRSAAQGLVQRVPNWNEGYGSGIVAFWDDTNAAGLNVGTVLILVCYSIRYENNEAKTGDMRQQTVPMVNKGETIDFGGEKNICLDSGLVTFQKDGVTINATWCKTYPTIDHFIVKTSAMVSPLTYTWFKNNFWNPGFGENDPWATIIINGSYYPKPYYGTYDIDIYETDEYGRQVLTSFDALKIIEAIVKQSWSDITINNRTGATTFPIHLGYFPQLIDVNPFDKHPKDALKLIADSMMCYIYPNMAGQLVIQNKTQLGSNGVTRDISGVVNKKRFGSKKYVWDKIIDGVEITVISNELVEGEIIQGFCAVQAIPNIEPRNKLEKEIIAPRTVEMTQTALNNYAAEIAAQYMNFYGKRHWAYNITFNLTDEILDWDLLDNVVIDGREYFFESYDIDLIERSFKAQLVSVTGYNYQRGNMSIPLRRSSYNSAGASIPSSGGGGSYVPPSGSYIFVSPFSVDGDEVSLLISDKLRLNIDGALDLPIGFDVTENQLTAISIGDEVDPNYLLNVGDGLDTTADVARFRGNIIVDGDVYLYGNVNQVNEQNLNVEDKIINLNVGGDNTTAIGGGIRLLGTGGATVASLTYEGGNWVSNLDMNVALGKGYKIGAFTRLTDSMVNLASGGIYKINDVDVLSSNTLGSTIINSSLTKVGTVTTGIWNATKIHPDYIDYNTANLKKTSDKLNTIQDIYTTASPQWLNVTLMGIIDVQGTGNSTFTSHLKHPDYVSQLSKWRISNSGEADFRYLYVDEMHAKTFIADIEQALAGAEIICKSVAKVAEDFTLPSAGYSNILIVESFGGFSTAAVFQNGDLIMLRKFSRSSGSLSIGYAWGTVTLDTSYGSNGFNTSEKKQAYTFTRHSTVPGTASGIIENGTLALDYGVSGNGFVEMNAIDGLWGQNSPYMQVATWVNTPGNYVLHGRYGNLRGITGVVGEYGTILGSGVGVGDKYIRASNQAMEIHNIPVQCFNGSNQTVDISYSGDVTLGSNTSSLSTTTFSFAAGVGSLRIGPYTTGANNIYVYDNSIKIRNYATVVADWTGESITLGKYSSNMNNLIIDPTSGIRFRNYQTVIASWNAGVITLGEYGSGKNNIIIDASSGIRFRNYSNVTASWNGDTIILGQAQNATSRLVLESGAISFIYRNSSGTDATKISLSAAGNASFTGTVTATAGLIANWDIDSERIYKTNSGAAFALYLSAGTAANSNNDKGLQLDVSYGGAPSPITNPKWISIGNIRGNDNGTSSWTTNKGIAIYDGNWNAILEISNARKVISGLTIKGEMVSSAFSTTDTLVSSSSYIGAMMISSAFYARKAGTITGYNRLMLDPEKLWLFEDGSSYSVIISCSSVNRSISIDGLNVPKDHGVRATAPTQNVKQGDTYETSGGAFFKYSGTQWWQYR